MLELGALSVSVEDAQRDSRNEVPLYGEPGTEPEVLAWQQNHVIALLPDDTEVDDFVARINQVTEYDWSAQIQQRQVADQDWVRLTQSQFDPIQIGQKLWIVPSWQHQNPAVQQATQDDSNILIELDPGLAFGTGTHPTTRLCAEWLEAHLQGTESVLDYGCGSGILALIASKLGARPVDGVDIDEQAVTAAKFNADKNQCAANFYLPDDFQAGQYQIVVANILSSPLKLMASMLCQRVAPNGHLVLSGILERQAQEVADAYAPWLQMQVWRSADGWVCLTGHKPSA